VDEAKAVFDDPKSIVLDGRRLFIDYASPSYRESEFKLQKFVGEMTQLHCTRTQGDFLGVYLAVKEILMT